MTDLILRQDNDHIARLVLNSPANHNALSNEMIAALTAAFEEIAADEAIRVIVLAAQGRAFCAGHDLRQMQAMRDGPDGGRAAFADLFDRCARMMQVIPTLPQPVIAEVQGVATAAGCQLVASCDMAVASESARFGVNGVNIGLFCSTPMVALTRAIPSKAAFEMLTTGDFIDAARAQQLGLINRIATPGTLTDATMGMAATIAAKLPAAIRLGKHAFHDQLRLGLSDAYATSGAAMCRNILLPDTTEGMAAFLEKRPPTWA
ncbi:enoyl-CoA hydratase [Paracoccus sediminis]|uniref:Enoyl-CoA hydratase domain-containing protein 3, mitochondrial n=1 Tax=Paracoccus sediminis TaxID=1214787 RepID=A0A238YT61_9RHOB|nr:enoyl-CoA hydratase [Paracoccus sediminis]TBN46008.1 enoyl-CoA hydratase [Paracoccus sediminis]SNR73998.1 Enoyl-CoA hydratase/carnithine racemase [Paracoccus sediminis]